MSTEDGDARDQPRTAALARKLYNMYSRVMISASLSQFRGRQSEFIDKAQRAPVEITSRGARRRAVVVSPEFFDRAIRALEDQADIEAAAASRADDGPVVSHEDLMAELGLDPDS